MIFEEKNDGGGGDDGDDNDDDIMKWTGLKSHMGGKGIITINLNLEKKF
jgi:hypothetical protein